MCRNCLREDCPDRGSVCLESGVYLLNYKGCSQCGERSSVGVSDREETTNEEDGDEEVNFKHVCESCNHVIAKHEYTFTVTEEYQEYTMNCLLCGYGEATVSILPDDPREQKLF
ncbi:protein Churchill-like isoform X2 [Oscarella lobularis]|uniref:protein Churchill-like isoform X2 n=1 Tax=Oscarella lobularis TaxID=121494 RepID=UPI003313CD73